MTSPPMTSSPLELPPRARHRAQLHESPVPERDEVPVGTLDAGVLAHVDGAGLVQLVDATWSLDWWVGAEDRWHHASSSAAVRSSALDGSPVRATAMRVPGGDIAQRVAGVMATWVEDGETRRGPAVVIEFENLTAVPVALALAVRPITTAGDGRIVAVGVDDDVITVDGATVGLLSRPAARAIGAGCPQPERSVAAGRLAAGVDAVPPTWIEDRNGRAELAVVVPLPHTAVVRLLLPVGASGASGPWNAPEATSVAAGWSAHTADGASIVLPEPGWDEDLVWASGVLALAGPSEVGACLDRGRPAPVGPGSSVRAAEVAEAMARLGLSDQLVPVLRGLAEAQRLGGRVRLGDRSDGSVALLHAAAGVLDSVTANAAGEALIEEFVAPVAVAIRRVARGRAFDVDTAADAPLVGSAVRALRSVAPALVRIGQPEVAADALAAAQSVAAVQLDATTADVAPMGGTAAEPGPGTSTLAATLRARAALARCDAEAWELLRERWAGPGQLGRSDAEAPDGTPLGELGFDVAELAARVSLLLDLLVADGPSGPRLLNLLPAAWLGASLDVRDVRCPWGVVSWSLRWHGERAALLWQVEDPDERTTVPEISAPGISADWSARAASGEALLEPDRLPDDALGSVPVATDAVVVEERAPDVAAEPPASGESFS